MKRIPPLTKQFLFLCLFSVSHFLAYATNADAQARESLLVTASEYCAFLNATAASDAKHLCDLYSETMASDPTTASIARVGTPEQWHYQVIAGRENFPLAYVTYSGKESYCDWLKSFSATLTSNFNSHIEDVNLACNNDSFEIQLPSIMLTLAAASQSSASQSTSLPTLEKIGGIVGILGLVALGHEMITLQDFREAAATHPPEQRLIITGEGETATIQPKDSVGNGSENLATAKQLTVMLQSEYPGVNVQQIVDEHLPKEGAINRSRPDLTAAKLQEILRRVDEARRNSEVNLRADRHSDEASRSFSPMPQSIEMPATRTAQELQEEADREIEKQNEYEHKAKQAAREGRKNGDESSWKNAAIGARLASERLTKAIEARAVGIAEKLQEASCLEEAARESQKQSKYSLKAISARAAENSADAASYDNVAYRAFLASRYLVIAAEAIGEGKSQEIIAAWKEAAEESRHSAEFHIQAIQARAKARNEDAASWDNAGYGAARAEECLRKAIEARRAGKTEEAEKWEEATREKQKQIDYCIEAIKARNQGKEEDAKRFTVEARIAGRFADFLRDVADNWSRASKASDSNNRKTADFFSQLARFQYDEKEKFKQLFEKQETAQSNADFSKESSNRYIRFKDAVVYYQKALESLDEAIKKRAEDQEEAAALYHSAYEQYQHAAGDLSKSAEKLRGKKGTDHDGKKSEITFNTSANYAVNSARSFTKAAEYARDVSYAQLGEPELLDLFLRYYLSAQLDKLAAEKRKGKKPVFAKKLHDLAEEFKASSFLGANESKSSESEEEKLFDIPRDLINKWMNSEKNVEERKSSFDNIFQYILGKVETPDSRSEEETDTGSTDSIDSEKVDQDLIDRLLQDFQQYTNEAKNLEENQQEGLASIASFVASTKKAAATSWEELQRDQALVNQPGTSEFADLRRQATQKTDYANNVDQKYQSIKKGIEDFLCQSELILLTEEKEEWENLSKLSSNILKECENLVKIQQSIVDPAKLDLNIESINILKAFENLVKIRQSIEDPAKLDLIIESINSLDNTLLLVCEASGCINNIQKMEIAKKFIEAVQTRLEIANLSFHDFDRLSELQARAKRQTEEAYKLRDKLVSASNQDVSLGMISVSSETESNDLEWDQQKAVEELSELTLNDFRKALEDYPTASRFIIDENGTIQPREAKPNSYDNNQSENLEITRALRATLEREHPILSQNVFPQEHGIIVDPSDLGADRLKNVFEQVNFQYDDHQKKEIYALQNKAYRAGNSAIDAYRQLLDAYYNGNPSEEFTNDAYQKAVDAQKAWSEVVAIFDSGFKFSSDDLSNREWWESESKSSENRKEAWDHAVLSYQLNDQGNFKPEKIKQIEDPRISKKDLEGFPYATLVVSEETDGSRARQKSRKKVLKTMMSDPYIRVEEVVNAVGHILDRKEMSATHLLVTLEEEKTPEEFLEKLKEKLQEQPFNLSSDPGSALKTILDESLSIKRTTPYAPLYELDFKPLYEKNVNNLRLFEQILEVTQSLAVISEPDFLSDMCTFPHDSNPSHPGYEAQWNLKEEYGIDALGAWQIIGLSELSETLEEKPLIAIIDSGAYQEHQNFNGISWVEAMNAVESNGNTTNRDIRDNYGHGTHVTGIIAAVRSNSRCGVAGIAPSVRIIPCKIFNSKEIGKSYNNDIIKSIYHACDKKAKILNLSLCSNHTKNLLLALQRARNEGAIIVAAAGNAAPGDNGTDNDIIPRYPANYGIDYPLDNIISVAATARDGKLWTYSNYGASTVHLAAPGESILSTTNLGNTNTNVILLGTKDNNHPYLYESGTSMAAPHVTAALAMMMKQFRGLTYQKLLNRLFKTTDATPSSGGDSRKVRWGKLNLARAISKDRDYSDQNAPSKKRAEKLSVISEASYEPEPIQKLATQRRELAERAIEYYNKAAEAFEYNNTTEPFNLAKENAGDSWDRAGDAALNAAEQINQDINGIDNKELFQKRKIIAGKAKSAADSFSQAAKYYEEGNNNEGSCSDNIANKALHIAEQIVRLPQIATEACGRGERAQLAKKDYQNEEKNYTNLQLQDFFDETPEGKELLKKADLAALTAEAAWGRALEVYQSIVKSLSEKEKELFQEDIQQANKQKDRYSLGFLSRSDEEVNLSQEEDTEGTEQDRLSLNEEKKHAPGGSDFRDSRKQVVSQPLLNAGNLRQVIRPNRTDSTCVLSSVP